MAAKKGGLGKGLDSLLVNKVNADHSSDSTIVKEKSTTTKKKSTKKETPTKLVGVFVGHAKRPGRSGKKFVNTHNRHGSGNLL